MSETISERLGYPRDQKLLIIHIDDLGVSHSTNLASFEALRKGIANSGSLMMPCSWAPEAVEMAKANPEFDLGVHATFTSERSLYRWGPITGAPSLVDRYGFFHTLSEESVAHGAIGDYERELRAQVERALAFGLRPTHLDAHMFTAIMRRDLFMCYLRLAREYGLVPLVFSGAQPGATEFLRKNAPGWEPDDEQRLRAEGFIPIDSCLNIAMGLIGSHTQSERFGVYHEAIRRCVPGLNYLFCHMTYDDDETQRAMGEKPARSRFFDFQAFTDESTRRAIEQAGVKLVTFRQLQRLFTGA